MKRLRKAFTFTGTALLLVIVPACSDLTTPSAPTATAVGSTPQATVLSAYIIGPTTVVPDSMYTWSANPSGGNGVYTYQWKRQVVGSYGWTDVGTGSSYTRPIALNTATFNLRLVVTSDGTSVTPTIQVTVDSPCSPATC